MQLIESTSENRIAPRPSPLPAAKLTSWKEIAQYLGKGVRTVQRWEQTYGLPVRRPDGKVKGIVLAVPNELDAWLQSRFAPKGGSSESELDMLRRRVAELLAENQLLRRELERKRHKYALTRMAQPLLSAE